MKDHSKLCHGDFNPSNVIIKDNGEHAVIDWAHVTQGNASADSARTFLLFAVEGKEQLAEAIIDCWGNSIRNLLPSMIYNPIFEAYRPEG